MALWYAGSSETGPEVDSTDLSHDPASLHHWLALVTRYGFGKVTNGPIESGALFKIVDLFGYVRETNYGQHFEV